MNREQTLRGLKELRLRTMFETAEGIMDTGKHLSMNSEEFLGLLVDAEMSARSSKRFSRMIKRANLRPENACLENLRFTKDRGLKKEDIQEFYSTSWVEKGRNIILTGPTGVGKTYLGEALIFQACKMGVKGRKLSLSLLFEEVRIARATGNYIKFLKGISTTKVLVIDDFLITKPTVEEAGELLSLLEERVAGTPTIITSQYPTNKWYERIPDPTIADALCDRLLEGSKIIKMDGPSQRGKNSK